MWYEWIWWICAGTTVFYITVNAISKTINKKRRNKKMSETNTVEEKAEE